MAKEHTDRTWLYDQYVNQGRTLSQIAKIAGVAVGTLQYWTAKHDIPMRNQSDISCWKKNGITKELLRKFYWEDELSVQQIANKYNVSYLVIYRMLKRNSIERRPHGSRCERHNWRWKNGETSNVGNGYPAKKVPGHPLAGKNGYVKNHVLEVEKSIGRYLTKEERVHHKNGKKYDFRLENLELFHSEKHHQQRERDLNMFAKQLLYGDIETSNRTELLRLFEDFLKGA